MKVTVKFFGAMRDLFQLQEKTLDISGKGDVAAVVTALCDDDKSRCAILDEAGNVRAEIKMLVKDSPPRFLKRAEDVVNDGDVITVFPPLIGG